MATGGTLAPHWLLRLPSETMLFPALRTAEIALENGGCCELKAADCWQENFQAGKFCCYGSPQRGLQGRGVVTGCAYHYGRYRTDALAAPVTASGRGPSRYCHPPSPFLAIVRRHDSFPWRCVVFITCSTSPVVLVRVPNLPTTLMRTFAVQFASVFF